MKQNTASQRVAAELRARIRSGALAPGDLVPSARQIVREHGVALATAAKVLAMLRRERLVRVERGVGTVVRGPGGGPDLSRERIVEAAIAIADDEGLAAISMRAVAAELGVPTISLDRYVPTKDDLVLAMIDSVMAEERRPETIGGHLPSDTPESLPRAREARPLPEPPPHGWRARLENLARMQWDTYGRHPWLAHVLSITRPQAVPNGMQHTEWVLEALSELGMSPAETIQTGIAFIGFVQGLATSVQPERHAEQDTGMNSREWMEVQEATFATLLPRFPTLARLSAEPEIDADLDALFQCALRCFLDGLEARAKNR